MSKIDKQEKAIMPLHKLPSEKTLLEVQDLKTYFYTEEGVVKAVDGVSFTVNSDEVLGLVGETGCGKSVSALSILRLIRSPGQIVDGHIWFNSESEIIDLVSLEEKDMLALRGNTITMIFQDPMNSLNPVLRVGDQLSEVYLLHQIAYLKDELQKAKEENHILREKLHEMRVDLKRSSPEEKETIHKQIEALKSRIKTRLSIHDMAKRESAKLLDRIGLPNAESLLDRYPHELSGGMRQRIMIAMALACNARLLICDEPTTALDVTIQAQILDMIRELKKKIHNSVLFITHSLGVIYELCDRVAVMYSGYIVEYGTVTNIFENPQHPYTKGLMAAIPRILWEERQIKLKIIPGMVPDLIYPPRGCRFHPRCPEAMIICKQFRPNLRTMPNQVQVACHLYNDDATNENMREMYRPLTIAEKMEDEY